MLAWLRLRVLKLILTSYVPVHDPHPNESAGRWYEHVGALDVLGKYIFGTLSILGGIR